MGARTLDEAIAHLRHGRAAEAARICSSILKKDRRNADALFVQALAEMQRRNFHAADRSLGSVLSINPQAAPAWAHRGAARIAMQDFDGAVAAFDQALLLEPHFVEVHFNRAKLLKDLGRLEEALAGYDMCLKLAPQFLDALVNRGNVLALLGRHAPALACYDACLMQQPDLVEVLHNRGHVVAKLGRGAEALASYDRCLALAPGFAEAFNSRAKLLMTLGHHERAADDFRRALELDPAADYARGSLIFARRQLCDWDGIEAALADLSRRVRAGEPIVLPFMLLGLSASLDDQLQCARNFAARSHPPAAAMQPRRARGHDRMRIAYVCSDFRDHATLQLAAGLFEIHDRSRFETVAVSLRRHPDSALRDRVLASFDSVVDAADMDDRDIAALLNEKDIDIAVDLNGYIQDSRPGIFALRAAPVQVSFLAFPGTMGADYIDYLIADRHVVRPDEHDKYAEKIVTLPGSYQVNDSRRRIGDAPQERASHGLPQHGFVFCCFNQAYKIAPPVFDIWMRLLTQVDGSVLWLLATGATAAGHLRAEAERRGVSGDRLVFAPPLANADHLARHRLADLFLDTLPYNAHTTASDALWAGVPVVTCEGSTFAGRVATSLLHAVGLPDLVTSSARDYEALALRLAREPDLLAAAKTRLARNRDVYPLFDTKRFRANLESAYAVMIDRHRAGRPPISFTISETDWA